ncbi:septum site-determining protein MinC [Lyngbya confervoides]|uniref:Probable septum site-determining protein MinC n=1 Tax=Lyngbya confervoides BDU141951 TaxID=1574623 RepID=A0ABD4T6T8_9CYAN|nr:septum site-determining protein MinC [Lyngbya confervoides]MCM1984218.1 septum site-determining protein MinC [Lyngbya confervoides BDU141951]
MCDGRVVLLLPEQDGSESDWSSILQRIQQHICQPTPPWAANSKVDLIVGKRLLDPRQMQVLAKALGQAKLILDCVHTSRRQTAVAAVTAGYSVQQTAPDQLVQKLNQAQGTQLKFAPPPQPQATLATPLFLTKTIRSGSEIQHGGHIFLLGDVNPGGTIIADGDIVIWGRLRGVAHAGASGDRGACIMALRMEPTQLRIANKVARAPAAKLEEIYPEVAHIAAEGIRITRAYDYSRLT